MPRAKGGPKSRRRRKKTLKLAEGFRGLRSKAFTSAKRTVDRALAYSYAHRRLKKRDLRALPLGGSQRHSLNAAVLAFCGYSF